MLIFWCDANACIANGNIKHNIAPLFSCFGADIHPTIIRKLNRVAQQIKDNLAQPQHIATKRWIGYINNINYQLYVFFLCSKRQ